LEQDAYRRGDRSRWHRWSVADLPDLPVRRKFDHEWQRANYKRQRALLTKARTRMSADDLAECFRASQSIRKWESCVAFRVSKADERAWRQRNNMAGKQGGVWSFFGLAAC